MPSSFFPIPCLCLSRSSPPLMFAIRLSPLLCRFSVSPPDYIVMAASRVPTWKIWNASGSVQPFCVSPLSLHPIRNPRGAVVNVTGPHPYKLKKLASFFFFLPFRFSAFLFKCPSHSANLCPKTMIAQSLERSCWGKDRVYKPYFVFPPRQYNLYP